MMFLKNFGDQIEGLLRTIFLWFFKGILQLITWFYDVFDIIARINIFDNENYAIISGIYKRVQAILVIVMVFYLIFQFVQYILQPEVASDKQKGVEGSIKKIVTVVLLMAFTPTIFNFSYELKNRILDSNVIHNVVMNGDVTSTMVGGDYGCNNNGAKCTDGGKFAAQLLTLFISPQKKDEPMCNTNEKISDRIGYMQKEISGATSYKYRWNCGFNDMVSNETDGEYFIVRFDWLVAIPACLFICWMFILYCIEAGRMIFQFALLQLIAPVPIMSYLSSNKENMFNKWLKQCTTTYIDVFIRLLIIDFVLLLCSIIPKMNFDFVGDNRFIVEIFLILGLMLFAVKAPALIKELLPKGGGAAAGGFGIGGKSSALNTLVGSTKGAARAIGSAYRRGSDRYRRHKKNRLMLDTMATLDPGSTRRQNRRKIRRTRRALIRDARAEAKEAYEQAVRDEAKLYAGGESYLNAKKKQQEYEKAKSDAMDAGSKLMEDRNKLAAYNARIAELEHKGSLSEAEVNELASCRRNRTMLANNLQKEEENVRELQKKANEAKKEIPRSNADDEFARSANSYKEHRDKYNNAEREYNQAKTAREAAEKEYERLQKSPIASEREKDMAHSALETARRVENDKKNEMNAAKTSRDEKMSELKDAQRARDGKNISTFLNANDEYQKVLKEVREDEKKASEGKTTKFTSEERKNKLKIAEENLKIARTSFMSSSSEQHMKNIKDSNDQNQKPEQLKAAIDNARKNTDEKFEAWNAAKIDYKMSKREAKFKTPEQRTANPVSETLGVLGDVASIVGGGVANFIGGAYQGAKDSDLSKTVKNVLKTNEKLIKRDELIAAGGDPSLRATIGGKLSDIASQVMGVPTTVENVRLQTKTLDRTIKDYERSNNNMLGIGKATDAFKSNMKELLDSNKLNSDMTGLNGEEIDKNTHEKIFMPSSGKAQDLIHHYISNANRAKDESRIANESAMKAKQNLSLDPALSQEYEALKMGLGSETWDAEYFANISARISEIDDIDKKDRLAEVARLQRAAVESAEEVTRTDNQMNYVKKLIGDEAMIQVIRHFANGGTVKELEDMGIDGSAQVKANEFLSQVKTACYDRKTGESVIAALKASNASQTEIDLFSKSNVSWPDLKDLSKQAIKNISKALEKATSDTSVVIDEFKQRKTEAEREEARLKAQQDYLNGSGSSSGK